jgi:osmotically-inducible protein OsmY
MEREFDSPMSYGTENQKDRNYYQPDYDERYRNSEKQYRNYNDDEEAQRLESIYGDTANYGNANQGGFDREWWERMRNKVSGWFGSHKEMDRKSYGKYSGRGPKNYKRNEERIYEDVCDLLMENDGIDASDIEVKVDGNYVILSGNVHTRSEKRHAEDLAASVTGVWDVENRLRVTQYNQS